MNLTNQISDITSVYLGLMKDYHNQLLITDRERFHNAIMSLADETALYHEELSTLENGRTEAEIEGDCWWERIINEYIYYHCRFLSLLLHIGVEEEELALNLHIRIFNILENTDQI